MSKNHLFIVLLLSSSMASVELNATFRTVCSSTLSAESVMIKLILIEVDISLVQSKRASKSSYRRSGLLTKFIWKEGHLSNVLPFTSGFSNFLTFSLDFFSIFWLASSSPSIRLICSSFTKSLDLDILPSQSSLASPFDGLGCAISNFFENVISFPHCFKWTTDDLNTKSVIFLVILIHRCKFNYQSYLNLMTYGITCRIRYQVWKKRSPDCVGQF